MTPAAPGRHAPPFDSRIVCWLGILLIAGYGFLFAGEWAHGYTLFGHKNLAIRDFAVFWGAGRLAASGHAAAVYDWTAIRDLLNAALGRPSSEYVTTFYYPPWFLLALAPLGALPFATAAAIWLAAALVAYVAAVRAILPGGTALIAALAAPTVFYNLFTGQDGLLTASLFAGALVMLDSAPLAAGLLIGLLAYKPHFGLLLPLFLAMTGRWRVFAGATATVAAIAAIAAAVFGADLVAAFARVIPTAGDAYLQHARLTGTDWEQLASLYGLLRVCLGSARTAWCGQMAIAVAAAAAVLWVIARRDVRRDLEAATIATATVIVTPYSEIYDLTILTVAVAFLVRDGLAMGVRGVRCIVPVSILLLPLLDLALPLAGLFGHAHFAWLVGPLMCAILASVIGRRAMLDLPARQPARNAEIARARYAVRFAGACWVAPWREDRR